jgi:Cys-rich four helix bundle protein (predicted Tat secretion target)
MVLIRICSTNINLQFKEKQMERRDFLKSAVAIATVAAAGSAVAEEHKMDMGHDHMSMDHDHMSMGGMHHHGNPNEKLIAATADCIAKANICFQHCLTLLGEGDKVMAACAKSASQVSAICTALEQFAAGQSKNLSQLAKVAMDVCKDCEDECKKTEKHPECKACGESCAACFKECKALVG